MKYRSDTDLDCESADGLQEKRAKLVAFVEEFANTHNMDAMTTTDLDLWIERLRPIRLEIHRIDMALRKLSSGVKRAAS